MRIAVNTVPEVGVTAIAQPSRARVPSSTTVVIHGQIALPFGGSTTSSSCLALRKQALGRSSKTMCPPAWTQPGTRLLRGH
ncbi:hypothetical protein ACGFYQ_41720 [Streptomyces sp. NPDC048258]|uniref:hypothetical protein n=1 Tax=Streptomyces sp. NPDC048258 TaxID=3365527 RepID=UPI00371A2FB3